MHLFTITSLQSEAVDPDIEKELTRRNFIL